MKERNIIMKKEGYGVNVLIVGNKCYRCGHAWVPRDLKEVPEICPSCKSPYWKTPKKIFKKGERKNGK
jgi:predicted Zn-ribbon and HTH transcriptional regulator